MFLLDTNVISELRKPRPHGGVVAWVQSVPVQELQIPAIVFGELQQGVEKTRSQNPEKAAEIDAWIDELQAKYKIAPMDASVFREWARLMVGKSADLAEDAMIAATARLHGLTVATRNETDFQQLDVSVFNPFHFSVKDPS